VYVCRKSASIPMVASTALTNLTRLLPILSSDPHAKLHKAPPAVDERIQALRKRCAEALHADLQRGAVAAPRVWQFPPCALSANIGLAWGERNASQPTSVLQVHSFGIVHDLTTHTEDGILVSYCRK
jgi:hypothetical protein